MAIYVIGYDIHPKVGETYDELTKAIKAIGPWWHCLDSTWLVKSELSAEQVRDIVLAKMKNNDQLLVVTYSRAAAWAGFNEECNSWLRNNL